MKKNQVLWLIFPCMSIYGFSVYDDILSRPRYQVKFKDIPISAQIANDRLLYDNNTYNRNLDREILKLNNEKYLCTTPKVEHKPIDNEETPDVKAKKENETKKALENGLKLISPLENSCIYYLEGWWIYVLCYNKYAKQFHPLDWDGTQKSLRILENQSEIYYLLGRFNTSIKEGISTFSSKIEYNGDSYYISQKVGGGTYCNFIQENRHVEIQYMCEPDAYDKIVFVTEISACSYKIIVHTSRLCKEPFFNQLTSKNAHVISCEKILNDDEYTKWMNTMFPKTVNSRYLSFLLPDSHNYILVQKNPLKKINIQKSSYIYKSKGRKMHSGNDQENERSTRSLKEGNQGYLLLNHPGETQKPDKKNNAGPILIATIYDSSAYRDLLGHKKKHQLKKVKENLRFSEKTKKAENEQKTRDK
ncbi:hypothetical protein PMAC_001800 [Pneumocystis sp. 'macacae']|nr:hypothetical protein PMAC_001800 [Pneumocystis sp. 'macacae']